MIDLTLEEAQLFRILAGFFGKDRVVPRMSILSVCGGEIPEKLEGSGLDLEAEGLRAWARANSCLFTIINGQGDVCLVIELTSDFEEVVDIVELERRRYLVPLLALVQVPYLHITPKELLDLLHPGGVLDIFTLIRDKLETLD
ncbi:MAG: hypothetical protein GX589_02620 [Deltaproteobacteria bacterium]|nr:hypothetical protein [Deltaproteobacteria bacterium]